MNNIWIERDDVRQRDRDNQKGNEEENKKDRERELRRDIDELKVSQKESN